jgi:hypothetical protein
MEDVGMFYDRLVCFMAFCIFCGHWVYYTMIWYIFPILVRCAMKNLATLVAIRF